MTLDQHVKLTRTPYGLWFNPGNYRYLLTIDGERVPSQYGSMDRETACRIYRAFRDAWLAS